MTRKQIEQATDNAGWNVTIEKDKQGYSVAFQMYTDTAGQDVNVELQVAKLDDLKHEVYEYWQNYDVDEEASLWIGDDGHGKNGAPYHISDILKDMQEVEDSLESLYDELNKIK